MNTKYPTLRNFAVLVAAVLSLYACTKTVVTGSFNRVPNTAIEYAYINEQADFSQYTKLMNGGLSIYYPENEEPPDPAEIDRIRGYFRDAFTEAIGDAYEIVDEPGPDVMKVQGQVIDMKMTSGGATLDVSGRLRDVVAHGELTFLMEMSDSVTGQVLARAGDKSSDISEGKDGATWDDVRRAAEYWAGLFRNWLDNYLGEPE
ncbi:MAG TPA: DUF3313 domain-containing protein [Woeseiaceae bacterium]|nr:DUF3313 domain-containing protein [Woeseiaceae bacterium]